MFVESKNSDHNDSPNIDISDSINYAEKIIIKLSEEKLISEIALNNRIKILEKISQISLLKSEINTLYEQFRKSNSQFMRVNEVKYINSYFLDGLEKISKYREKVIEDLKRDKSILNINEWSVSFYNVIKDLKNSVEQIIHHNKYSELGVYTFNIILNLQSQFAMMSIFHEKMIDTKSLVVFSHCNEIVDEFVKKIDDLIKINKIDDKNILQFNQEIRNFIADFNKLIDNNNIISLKEFSEKIDKLTDFICYLKLIEKKYLKEIQITNLSKKKNPFYKYSLICLIMISCLVLIFLRKIATHLMLSETFFNVRNQNYKFANSKFWENVINALSREETSSHNNSCNLELMVNNENKKTTTEKSDESDRTRKKFEDEDRNLFLNEVEYLIKKINSELNTVKEKINSLSFKKSKFQEIYKANSKKDLKRNIMIFSNEYKRICHFEFLKNIEELNPIECNEIFDYFNELSYRSDMVKNIFLEIVSELKLINMNSIISEEKNVGNKLDNLIRKLIEKSMIVKSYNNDARDVYLKAEKLIMKILSILNGLKKSKDKVFEVISLNGDMLDELIHDFESLYNHYIFTADSIDTEKKEISVMKSSLNLTSQLLENINSKTYGFFHHDENIKSKIQ